MEAKKQMCSIEQSPFPISTHFGGSNLERVHIQLIRLAQLPQHRLRRLQSLRISFRCVATHLRRILLRRFVGRKDRISVTEIGKHHPIRESFSADSDSFEDSVTSELIEHERSIDESRSLLFVGDDASEGWDLVSVRGLLYLMKCG